MNRYPIKICFYTKKAGKAHVFIPCADLIKMKEVNTVVELDAYKQQLQAYESPLQEVRDSL